MRSRFTLINLLAFVFASMFFVSACSGTKTVKTNTYPSQQKFHMSSPIMGSHVLTPITG